MSEMASIACPTRPVGGIAEIADRYDGFLIDQWGVLHDGQCAYPGAVHCLQALKAAGKPVVIISNSGKRGARNVERLGRMGFARETYVEVVTSGDTAWHALQRRPDESWGALGNRCFLVSNEGDVSAVDGLGLEIVREVARADFIFLAGADGATSVTALDPLWEEALQRRLPLLCTNPDTTRIADGRLAPGSGALASRYRQLGGTVRYVGKPHREIYERCLQVLEEHGAAHPLAVGDSLEHDIAGGFQARLDTVLVTCGVLRDHFDGQDGGQAIRALLSDVVRERRTYWPTWIMTSLRWSSDD
jgi:HAD superfamily hydrolase (TIGR01459 family)